VIQNPDMISTAINHGSDKSELDLDSQETLPLNDTIIDPNVSNEL
jgi:hypothetical protein